MRSRCLRFLTGGSLLLTACSAGGANPDTQVSNPETESPTPGTVAIEPVPCEELELAILTVAPTRAELRSAFGEPDSAATETEPNRHVEGAADSLFVVHYPGLVVSIRKPEGGEDMADRVEVTAPRYIRYPWLAPGASAQQVEASLGDPTDGDPERLTYNCNLGADQPVTFQLRDGRVTAVTIEYYVD